MPARVAGRRGVGAPHGLRERFPGAQRLGEHRPQGPDHDRDTGPVGFGHPDTTHHQREASVGERLGAEPLTGAVRAGGGDPVRGQPEPAGHRHPRRVVSVGVVSVGVVAVGVVAVGVVTAVRWCPGGPGAGPGEGRAGLVARGRERMQPGRLRDLPRLGEHAAGPAVVVEHPYQVDGVTHPGQRQVQVVAGPPGPQRRPQRAARRIPRGRCGRQLLGQVADRDPGRTGGGVGGAHRQVVGADLPGRVGQVVERLGRPARIGRHRAHLHRIRQRCTGARTRCGPGYSSPPVVSRVPSASRARIRSRCGTTV